MSCRWVGNLKPFLVVYSSARQLLAFAKLVLGGGCVPRDAL